MIEKMAYVNITGPKTEFDRVTEKYVSNYDIHLENAVLRLEGQDFVSPIIDADPYKDLITKIDDIYARFPENSEKKLALSDKDKEKELKRLRHKYAGKEMSGDEAVGLVVDIYEKLHRLCQNVDALKAKRDALKADRECLAPFRGLAYRMEEVLRFRYVAVRFGRVPKAAWNDFEKHVQEDESTIFTKCQTDSDYVWGVFFVPENEDSRADSVYAALRFERVKVCEQYEGTPTEIYESLTTQIDELKKQIEDVEAQIHELINDNMHDKLWLAKDKLGELSHNHEARKLAACIEDDEDFDGVDTPFFFICGWMRVADAKKLAGQLDEEEKEIICVINDDPQSSGLNPPTSIKNKGIFKPYEMYTKMYGLPNYNEFDPTVLIAILYSFIFGAMFGDLGHGLCLLIGGAAIYFIKRSNIAGIISFAGFFSSIFGLLYGSFFGFEDVIPTLWLKPREAMVNLNFIGRLNTVFAIAVLFGMILMLFLMILNVISHIKQKNFAESIFTSNGIAGFLFYGTVVLIAVLYVTGKTLPATIIIIALIVISVLMLALNEPLTNIIKKRKALETSVGMYCVETFFDLFETVLTYFSNTLSFLRVGAFAISHAAMMEVVLSLGGYTEGGNGSIVVLIIGNIFVMGFEGLIVGIQVLRLQYYEIFSKFYRGDGREFKPFFKKRRSN